MFHVPFFLSSFPEIHGNLEFPFSPSPMPTTLNEGLSSKGRNGLNAPNGPNGPRAEWTRAHDDHDGPKYDYEYATEFVQCPIFLNSMTNSDFQGHPNFPTSHFAEIHANAEYPVFPEFVQCLISFAIHENLECPASCVSNAYDSECGHWALCTQWVQWA